MRGMRTSDARGGFTLIELLGVIVIVSILMYFLITRLSGVDETVKVRVARQKIEQIAAELADYEVDKGDYPRSTFRTEWGQPPNNLNVGCEALYLALWQKGIDGAGLGEDLLGNHDGDATTKRLTVNPSLDLFELQDPWENPLAYFHHSDYGRKDRYSSSQPDTGEALESELTARKSTKTGNWFNPQTFQLISAGPDALFGTEDDIGNFDSGS
ncbi:MAG: prepilin-type N-terminal cleavage/methylation domain-containing protein [Planctomycetes bacterium]|nr:prepilin-type N-terminal cleavage/methylation domain-containing protein [Planctomycetota bacterium]